MAKREKRASWFKLFLHQKPIMDAVSDKELGCAVKAALHYFETGEMPQLGPVENVVFLTLKPYIDEAESDYRQKVENGKKGGRPKNDTKPEVSTTNHTKPVQTETETDTEADAETDTVYIPAVKPPKRTRFIPPTADAVQSYCHEKGYLIDAERFVDYYTSNGWYVGKNPMRDWKAALRCWNRKEHINGKTENRPTWTVGTQL